MPIAEEHEVTPAPWKACLAYSATRYRDGHVFDGTLAPSRRHPMTRIVVLDANGDVWVSKDVNQNRVVNYEEITRILRESTVITQPVGLPRDAEVVRTRGEGDLAIERTTDGLLSLSGGDTADSYVALELDHMDEARLLTFLLGAEAVEKPYVLDNPDPAGMVVFSVKGRRYTVPGKAAIEFAVRVLNVATKASGLHPTLTIIPRAGDETNNIVCPVQEFRIGHDGRPVVRSTHAWQQVQANVLAQVRAALGIS